MAMDKEAVGLSKVHMHESCILFSEIIVYCVLEHSNELLECTQSANNNYALYSFTVLWENEYCLTSNLHCPFTSLKSWPSVILLVLL